MARISGKLVLPASLAKENEVVSISIGPDVVRFLEKKDEVVVALWIDLCTFHAIVDDPPKGRGSHTSQWQLPVAVKALEPNDVYHFFHCRSVESACEYRVIVFHLFGVLGGMHFVRRVR